MVIAFFAAPAFAAEAVEAAKLAPPPGATRLDPTQPVWIDASGAKVLVDGRVALREGVLEMFACPAGTKEHESVVAVDAKAYLLHAGLLRIGAEEGSPVRFDPVYRPPTGTVIDVVVQWEDGGEQKTARAQDWVRNTDSGKAMDLPFVFAGSGFWTDPDTGVQHYQAESGDLICVSNFGAAMLDVPAPSSQANGELWFEPFTERIPPLGTPVRLVLSVSADQEQAAATPSPAPSGDGLAAAINELRAAEVSEGSTNSRRKAWETAASASPEQLPVLLSAMNGASPLAENWLRTAVDAIADSAPRSSLPLAALRTFVADLSQSPRARRTAFELIGRIDADLADTMLDHLLDDPSDEIRYEAVAKVLRAADEASSDAQAMLYRTALRRARSLDQVEAAAEGLKKGGEEVSLAKALGLVTKWSVIGPFDNRAGKGFDTVYPPEKSLDPNAQYSGQDEKGPQGPFRWKPYETFDRLGETQLNDAIGSHKGAVGYAWVRIVSDTERDFEVRYASVAATKVWLNNELIAANEIYHSGSPFDQYQATGRLRAGENQLLVKVCQNEQTEPWAQTWPLQLRLTGPGGAPLEGVTVRPGG